MRSFTDEEFARMVRELTVNDPPSFHTLIEIAERTLRPTVERWCREDKRLVGRQLEDDIIQETLIRLMKKCVTGFLYRSEELNDDPDGFRNWMFEVALNIKRDFADRQQLHDNRERGFEEGEVENIPDDGNSAKDIYDERLAKAFAIILDSDVKIYKILTWLAQCVFIVEYGITKKLSNDVLTERFSEKTLYEMRDEVYSFAEGITWMNFTEGQKRKIDTALAEEYKNGKTYGDTKYREFFMKKDGKATISDWMNRMNGMIKRNMGN